MKKLLSHLGPVSSCILWVVLVYVIGVIIVLISPETNYNEGFKSVIMGLTLIPLPFIFIGMKIREKAIWKKEKQLEQENIRVQAQLREEEARAQAALAAAEAKRKEEEAISQISKTASKMVSSPAVITLAGQLFTQFTDRIEHADKNKYIQFIEITLSYSLTQMQMTYEFSQKGSLQKNNEKKSDVDFEKYGVLPLSNSIECEAAAKAIATLLQSKLTEQYSTDTFTPIVNISNENTLMYNSRTVITFKKQNPDYEEAKGWL